MWARIALAFVVTLLVAGCGGAEPDRNGDAAPSSPDGQQAPSEEAQPVVTVQTPAGEAGMRLRVEPERIRPDEDVSIQLDNIGELELLTGLDRTIERWDGSGWVVVNAPEVPAVGLGIRPGESTPDGELPTWPGQFRDGDLPEPGTYRVTKTATIEGDAVHDLAAHTWFEVLPDE